ncbi:hypothetical protein N7462_007912 [Penicillium macrosclerotiorum]|uniref:uncharacterized protein n=1 Tax=Penicillium macrosclerotiorum TaxID=303699 RepID=UPI002546EC9C|nr:uncharacterized protein N7462_007912 [Penicillium macrosclerotiorum]KAJ5679668.1 hypothetical protein N7462_007912 [Penicillium macrosclerotiorum]
MSWVEKGCEVLRSPIEAELQILFQIPDHELSKASPSSHGTQRVCPTVRPRWGIRPRVHGRGMNSENKEEEKE